MNKEVFTSFMQKTKDLNFKNIIEDIWMNLKPKWWVRLSQKQKINFFDSLFNLISSGIPITNSLSIMLYQTKDKNLKLLLQTVTKDISKWKKLQDSLAQFGGVFSNFDIYMVKMWEVTGKLAHSFEAIKEREEKNSELKSKILGALIYPIIIISLSISMIIGFMTFVIPRVQKMYADARVNLPSLTQHVIDTSEFLQHNYLILILAFICLIYGLILFKRWEKTKIYADEFILKIPLFGGLIRKKILAIFSNTLGTLLSNGIMINEALEISKKSLDNAYYEKRIDEMLLSLNQWIPLSELMWIKKLKDGIEDPYFPIELASVVKIGEQTGKLPSLLMKVSVKFNKEIDVIVKWLSTAIEPIVIVFVWSIVGTMIMAILLPFFNMVNVV